MNVVAIVRKLAKVQELQRNIEKNYFNFLPGKHVKTY
jgi:hypothetical protein